MVFWLSRNNHSEGVLTRYYYLNEQDKNGEKFSVSWTAAADHEILYLL